MTAALEVSQSGSVRELRLCRPEVRNCFDRPLHHELTAALTAIAADSSVRAVLLSSSGKAFSAGGDFELMIKAQADAGLRAALSADATALLGAFGSLPQPVVAAVQGPAMGLGATVALACDVLVMARTAVLADTHVNVGLVAGDGGCLVWPQAVGMLRARRHLLTGEPLDAETAWRLGAATDLVDTPEEVEPLAREIAGRIAALAPLAVQGTKRSLNAVTRLRAHEVGELSITLEMQTMASEDLLEGVASFRERRAPEFQGR